jgi:hypothetical protein
MNPISLRLRRLLPRFAPLLLVSLLRLPVSAAEPKEAAPDHAEERKVLEMDLARFYNLLKQDPDARTKVTLIGYQRDYAARANKLLDNFDSAKYDELRYDINLQCQRLARKLAPLNTPPPGAPSPALLDVEINELSPSASDAAEVKAALGVADLAIQKLEARVAKLKAGTAEHAAEQGRLQRAKERRAALGKQFTEAGWNGLTSELRPQG